MKYKYLTRRLCSIVLVLLLAPLLAQVSYAQTLYERSLPQFTARASKANPGDFTFVVLGDSRDGDRVFKRALELAKSFDPLFILHGGDYSGSGGEGETNGFLQVLKEKVPDIPFFVVMGNHENREVFARRIGPFHFTLQSRRLGLNLVALDNADYVLKRPELEYLRSRLPSRRGGGFVAMHVPPQTERWSWHTFTEGAAELKKILVASHAQGAFFSHVHLFDRSSFGEVPAIISGGAGAPLYTTGVGDPAYHIVVVRVQNGKASYREVKIPE